jgi:hypothetical protein
MGVDTKRSDNRSRKTSLTRGQNKLERLSKASLRVRSEPTHWGIFQVLFINKGRVLDLASNIRVGWKVVTGSNALAYLALSLYRFYNTEPRFYLCSNILEQGSLIEGEGLVHFTSSLR